MLSGFAAHFANGETLGKFASHLRLGLRLLGVENLPQPCCVAVIVRGARKFSVPLDKPRLRTQQVLTLVRMAIDQNMGPLARLCFAARQYLLRVTDKCLHSALGPIPHQFRDVEIDHFASYVIYPIRKLLFYYWNAQY